MIKGLLAVLDVHRLWEMLMWGEWWSCRIGTIPAALQISHCKSEKVPIDEI